MSNSPPPASTLNRDANEPVNTQNESISASNLAQSKNELVSDEIKMKETASHCSSYALISMVVHWIRYFPKISGIHNTCASPSKFMFSRHGLNLLKYSSSNSVWPCFVVRKMIYRTICLYSISISLLNPCIVWLSFPTSLSLFSIILLLC